MSPEVGPQLPPKRCPITHSFLYCRKCVEKNISKPSFMKAEAELVIYHSPPLEGFPFAELVLVPVASYLLNSALASYCPPALICRFGLRLLRSTHGTTQIHPSTSASVSSRPRPLDMKAGLLQGGPWCSHHMQKRWLIPDERPQLQSQRELHHCLHVTDGWQRGQTGRINWQDYQGWAFLRFSASSLPTPPFCFGAFSSKVPFLFRCKESRRKIVEVALVFC